MEEKSSEKSRRERRKEARLKKSKKKFDSWVQNQTKKSGSKEKKLLKPKTKKDNAEQRSGLSDLKISQATEHNHSSKKPTSKKRNIHDPSLVRTSKRTKFFDFLQSEVDVMAEEDMAKERKLAKKLRVKKGVLGVADDVLDDLLEGIHSVLENPKKNLEDHKVASLASFGESDDASSLDGDLIDEISRDESDDNSRDYSDEYINGDRRKNSLHDHLETESQNSFSSSETNVKSDGEDEGMTMLSVEAMPTSNSSDDSGEDIPVGTLKKETSNGNIGKYVAPHLRSCRSKDAAEYVQMRNKLRGLLNRLSETNLEGITRDVSSLFRSVGRSIGSEIISEEVVASCSRGPRGNEQYAAVFAAFVAGMACSIGIDFGAKLLACLAKCFEEEYLKEDNISLRNMSLFLSYLYVFGVCSSELIYDFLIMLGKRLTEVDVSTVSTVLQCCGMKLRGDDPVGMKNFISSVQTRAHELKASAGNEKSNIYNKRIEFMIETICDIKNNKKKTKEDPHQHVQIKNWLRKLRVENILLHGLTWSKLLDSDKKGQWWLSGGVASSMEDIRDGAGSFNQENLETAKMLDIAASQGMNTDARRAIFCVIMFGEGDPADAFDNLLRLKLPGKQDREIMRVLVHCCLEEKVFNKYFCILASKLCSYDRNHKTSLQYCLWDHFKELDNMTMRRSVHLSEFTAEMIASFTLSLTVLKVVEFHDPALLTPKRIFHFGLLFKKLLQFPDDIVCKVFARIAPLPECEPLRSGIEFFLRDRVVSDEDKSLASKFHLVRRALKQ